jgi:hypothetical protein
MKYEWHKPLLRQPHWRLAMASFIAIGAVGVRGGEAAPAHAMSSAMAVSTDNKSYVVVGGDISVQPGHITVTSADPALKEKGVVVRTVTTASKERPGQPEVAWLGVAIDEATEALTAQLGLDPGVGLIVTFVSPESPAAKAGLQKNDVLVELDGQKLVLPAQLRKLVQVHPMGSKVELVYYRAGKRHELSVVLGKIRASLAAGDGERTLFLNLLDRQPPENQKHLSETIQNALKNLKGLDGSLPIDKQKLQEELRRSVEAARKAYEEAKRHATNASSAFAQHVWNFEKLAKSPVVVVDKNATVTVHSTAPSTKSVVFSDDTSTIILIKNPKTHLTIHDHDGKLLFDGEIETAEQREKVPAELWVKVKPLLNKLTPEVEKPEVKPTTPKETF